MRSLGLCLFALISDVEGGGKNAGIGLGVI